MELIEKMARAIMDHRSPMQPGLQWNIESDENRDWYRGLAQAALTALIEHRQAAIKERDAEIVAWLRADADTLEREDTAWNAAYLAEAIRECADAIERGEV